MRAMILAAGRGERLRPLTDRCPKPLLKIGNDECLIERHLRRLASAGINEVVINHAWLGALIEARLGDGARYGVRIAYSPEPAGGLETAGGIAKALPLLGAEVFLVVNGDIYSDFDFRKAHAAAAALPRDAHAHLWLVNNPCHHPTGDFGIKYGRLDTQVLPRYTFSGMALYRPCFFASVEVGSKAALKELFLAQERKVTASLLTDDWLDVGTPARLALARTKNSAQGLET